MSFLDRIVEANRHDLADYRPFRVAGTAYGRIRHADAERLARWPEVFIVADNGVDLAPALATAEARSKAVEPVVRELAADGAITGWRGEPYPVNNAWTEAPMLLVERAAAPFFGVRSYGVHVNGFVRAEGGSIKLWVAKRAMTKQTGPGKLDQIAAGGQPWGIGLKENVIKECAEEAGIPAALAEHARPVSAISFALATESGFRPDVAFVFDLELPAGFEPVNTDGEVEAFYLWEIEEAIEVVSGSQRFGYDNALVAIDFLIRHGFIAPEHPDYVALVAGLRQRERLGLAP